MALFLLRPTRSAWKRFTWDMVHGFVIRAKDAKHARQLASEKAVPLETSSLWKNPRLTSCTELDPEGEHEIILSNYVS